MRIALITLHTPTETNLRGASALPYHLLAFRSERIDVEIWTYNLNGCNAEQISIVENNLGVRIHVIPKQKIMSILSLAPVRLLLSKPMLGYLRLSRSIETEINTYLEGSKSAVWIYGEDISGIADSFRKYPTVITTPDCEAMYYYRVMSMSGIPMSKVSLARYALMYHRYAKFTSRYPIGENITYHLVGRADTQFLKRLNSGARAVFIRHPHYEITSQARAEISEKGIIKLLIAGRYDFCMSRAVDEAIIALKRLPVDIKKRYQITFLGKDWESSCDALIKSGYDACVKIYVEDYAAEISSHQIQLTPVAVGTGTKGKVLDAFANGLLVIGTPLALENIAVESGKDCVQYSTQEELAEWLTRLAQDPSQIKEMARLGQASVLEHHSRQKVANQFFSLFNQG